MEKKQGELPGVGRKEIKELDEAAEDYVAKRDQRMALTKLEVAAKTKLTDLMKAHKLKAYTYEGERVVEDTGDTEPIERVVKLEKVDKLTVRRPKEEKSPEEVEEEEEKE